MREFEVPRSTQTDDVVVGPGRRRSRFLRVILISSRSISGSTANHRGFGERSCAGKIQDFKPNTGKIVKFGSKPALLVRAGENDWKAFSAVCTHLNCTVQFRDATQQIWCACHNGVYDLNGKVVSGPPPRRSKSTPSKCAATKW